MNTQSFSLLSFPCFINPQILLKFRKFFACSFAIYCLNCNYHCDDHIFIFYIFISLVHIIFIIVDSLLDGDRLPAPEVSILGIHNQRHLKILLKMSRFYFATFVTDITWCIVRGRNVVYGLRAQSPKYDRDQGSGLRAQKNGIRDHKAFEPESGIRFITRSKNLLSQNFSA